METVSTTEIKQYEKQLIGAVETAQALAVADYEGVMDAADFLLKVKSIGEQITERKEAITKPMNEALKSTRKLFKGIEEAYTSAEAMAKEKVLGWHFAEWKKGNQTDNKISGLEGYVTVVERDAVEITDEGAIPRALCTPDPEKVKHYLLSGKKLKGAKLIKSYAIAAGKN